MDTDKEITVGGKDNTISITTKDNSLQQTTTQPVTKKSFNFENIQAKAIDVGLNLLMAILILLIGRFIVKVIGKIIAKTMRKAKTDETLVSFATNLINFLGTIFVMVAVLGRLGIQTASIVAAVGAAGLAIGLAFQGALSNFAAGCLIIIFRPFKVGDLIQAGGELGTVREIELFTTKMITPDNKTVIVPNGQLTADKIVNYTETDELRMDLTFGVGYETDIDHVKATIKKVLDGDDRVLANPAPLIGVSEHGESSVNYAVRPWVKADNYWGLYFDLHEQIKKEFDKENISIPFPQSDIHIVSDINSRDRS